MALVLPDLKRVQNPPVEAIMGILILKVVATWSVVATVAGLSLGVAIRRGERIRKEVFLSCLFASLETSQESRG